MVHLIEEPALVETLLVEGLVGTVFGDEDGDAESEEDEHQTQLEVTILLKAKGL